MKIGIGNDHVAVEYKKEIKKYIEEKYGYEVVKYGTDSTERFNYPVSGEAVANADRKSTRLNSSHASKSRMPSSA